MQSCKCFDSYKKLYRVSFTKFNLILNIFSLLVVVYFTGFYAIFDNDVIFSSKLYFLLIV